MDNIEIIEGAGVAEIAEWMDRRFTNAESDGGQRYAVTMPGGSTPFPILKRWITYGTAPWARIEIWPNDDRIVPEDHEASNTGKMRSLLEPAGAAVMGLQEDSALPTFALTWLGMGEDGHIASLFPNTDPAIDDAQNVRRLTPDPLPPHAPFDRITMTLPALLNTQGIVFTLGGSQLKKDVFFAAMRGENDLPIARLLRSARQSVTCFT